MTRSLRTQAHWTLTKHAKLARRCYWQSLLAEVAVAKPLSHGAKDGKWVGMAARAELAK